MKQLAAHRPAILLTAAVSLCVAVAPSVADAAAAAVTDTADRAVDAASLPELRSGRAEDPGRRTLIPAASSLTSEWYRRAVCICRRQRHDRRVRHERECPVDVCIGSVTKLLTVTAIMRLVEAGKIDLDAPLSRYLPESKCAISRRRGAPSPSATC